MPSIETFLAFSLASLLLSLSPGPSNLYIMARSMSQGMNAGAAAATGMAVGSFIYVIATALGLAVVFEYSPLAYTALKLGGAAYLIYLGYSYLTAKPVHQNQQALPKYSNKKILLQSILVELTNPKTALFFLAFLPQFASPEAGNMTTQLILLGTTYMFIALACDLFVAAISGKLGAWMAKNERLLAWQDRFSGSILFGLGSYIGFQEIYK